MNVLGGEGRWPSQLPREALLQGDLIAGPGDLPIPQQGVLVESKDPLEPSTQESLRSVGEQVASVSPSWSHGHLLTW